MVFYKYKGSVASRAKMPNPPNENGKIKIERCSLIGISGSLNVIGMDRTTDTTTAIHVNSTTSINNSTKGTVLTQTKIGLFADTFKMGTAAMETIAVSVMEFHTATSALRLVPALQL
jgi:hypothetical protein